AVSRSPTPVPPRWWRFDSGVQAQYTRAGADAWGARVSAELSRELPAIPIVPSLRLSWGVADFNRSVDAGEIHFRLRTARVETCGGLGWRRMYSSLCAAFDLGQLAVASSGLPRNGRAESTWAALGLTARTRIMVVDPIGVELAFGVFRPSQRAEFTLIDPVRQVYRVPTFAFEGQLGIALSTRWK
ncbi:MAG: hypothetical protein K0S65_3687, partial [Labilithrix sp.]|nr:hypothetical protein [Labilithrix sp.]